MNVESVNERIRATLEDNDIVLFMKGTPEFPQCGFSARSAQLLNACGAKFASVDVLANPEIRDGIKRYANWPTIPQLYVKGELIGGSDILLELYKSGRLQELVANATAEQS
ncbi:MAG: Grx4 family monothiol glutaredoxin [Acidiferrobacterales bacterium]